tara:strand:+ start:56 stop:1102 length:1047 start_codon:yes stop_codon:yes gene_type:complete
MKFFIQIIFILIVFLKTKTVLSENNLFIVNNIKIEKNDKTTNSSLANKAIKKGFDQLIEKILLKQDMKKVSDLNFSSIKQLVTYYQVSNISEKENNQELANFNVTFDKEKIHDLFYNKGVSYSEISNKELYILPVLIKENEIYIFNNNYFYENWNEIYSVDLIEFILPLENIEVIKNINESKNNLINIEIENLFKEYSKKNLALVFIEDNKKNNLKIYLKLRIEEKNISKGLNIKDQKTDKNKLYEKILTESKKEIINLVKSENLIDIRTPSFLNAKLNLSKKTNLVKFNSRIKNIDLIENIYVQEFNKDYIFLKIKYLGKLNKIINQIRSKDIDLKFIDGFWIIKIL